MPLTPQQIRETRFKLARRGYDATEVDSFLEEAAAALEAAQNDATAMEARARAAVARLQELSQSGGEEGAAPRPSVDEAETISRTLLLAQRTADAAIADAQAEAERLLEAAREDSARLIEEARQEARRAGEAERVQVEGEVQALLARRDFLVSDVEHLEQYLVAQRERIVEAVAELNDLVQRVPNGLGDMRRPLLSAASDDTDPGEGPETELLEVTHVEVDTDDAADSGSVPARDEATPTST